MKLNHRVVVTAGFVVILLSTNVVAQMRNSHVGCMPMGQIMGMSGADLSDANLDMLAEHISIMHGQMGEIVAEKNVAKRRVLMRDHLSSMQTFMQVQQAAMPMNFDLNKQ